MTFELSKELTVHFWMNKMHFQLNTQNFVVRNAHTRAKVSQIHCWIIEEIYNFCQKCISAEEYSAFKIFYSCVFFPSDILYDQEQVFIFFYSLQSVHLNRENMFVPPPKHGWHWDIFCFCYSHHNLCVSKIPFWNGCLCEKKTFFLGQMVWLGVVFILQMYFLFFIPFFLIKGL